MEPATVDEYGTPVDRRGVSEVPGPYFVGLQWLHVQGCSLLFGVGNDAKHVVETFEERVFPSPEGT